MNRWLIIGALILIAHVSTLQTIAAQKIGLPKLPSPSGHFGIGRLSYDWTDPARAATGSSDSKAHRELMVYLWYPTPRSRQNAGAYLPGAKQINATPEGRQRMEGEFESNWPLVVSGAIASHAVENAPIAKSPVKFPVVLFSHGLNSTSFEYTALLEELVSHGYVVIATEHTDVAAAVAFLGWPHRHSTRQRSGLQWYTSGAVAANGFDGAGNHRYNCSGPSLRTRQGHTTQQGSKRALYLRGTVGF